MAMNVCELKNWRFLLRGRKSIAEGTVYRSEQFPKGMWTRIGKIDSLEIHPDELRICACGKLFVAKFEEHVYDTGNIVNCTQNYIGTEKAEMLKAEIERVLEQKKIEKVKSLTSPLSYETSSFVLLCLDKDANGNGDCYVVCDSSGNTLHEFHINSSSRAESSCEATNESNTINIGYLVRNSEALFYKWQAPEGYKVYVKNIGERNIRCSGMFCEFDLKPGEIHNIELAG